MKQKRSVKKLRTHVGNFLFLFPAMLLYCFVVIVPFIQGIPYSFTNRASVVSQSYDFVGLRNYMELITNKLFPAGVFSYRPVYRYLCDRGKCAGTGISTDAIKIFQV